MIELFVRYVYFFVFLKVILRKDRIFSFLLVVLAFVVYKERIERDRRALVFFMGIIVRVYTATI